MTLKTAPLLAREYQKQLFERAKKCNVIACVETGSGKTLVAALLLEHMFSLEIERMQQRDDHQTRRRRISLFLVNLVPLVHQQAAFLDANTSLNIALLYGEMDVDTSNRDYWNTVLKGETGVVVCTARIALNSIIHAYLSLADVNLIVFDEAHHAIGNNEYARIMSYYRLLKPEQRPKILGMTASPLSSGGTFDVASSELERILDSSIFTVSLSAREELGQFITRPTELIVEYQSHFEWGLGELETPYLQTELVREMSSSETFQKIVNRMAWFWEEHGAVFSDLAWLASRKDLRSRAVIKKRYAKQLLSESLLNPEVVPKIKELKEGARVHREVARILDRVNLLDCIQLTEANSSPKLRKLIDVLACFESQADTFCGIIFCKRRLSALALHLLIQKTPRLSFLKAEALTGHGGQNGVVGAADGMLWDEQQEVLRRLRQRDPTNLVIATSVLEEGLDITPVNCVIRFDLPDHHVAYVQSRGRARSSESTYILLAEQDNLDHAQLLSRIGFADRQMHDWLAALPEDRLSRFDANEDEGELMNTTESSAYMKRSYCDDRTGARIWPVDATSLLSHYVSLLKTDEYCPDGPIYEFNGMELAWAVTVRLPASSPLTEHTGPIMPSKSVARSAAAFETCILLHRLDELNEHLAPRKRPKLFAEQVSALVADYSGIGEQVEGLLENTLAFIPAIPAAFGLPPIPEEADAKLDLFVHILKFPGVNAVNQPMDPIAFITTRPIPQEGLCPIVLSEYQGHKDVNVSTPTAGRLLSIAPPLLKAARNYTMTLLALVARREYESDALPYFLLPLTKDHNDDPLMIDWATVTETSEKVSDISRVAIDRLNDREYLNDTLFLDDPFKVDQARPYRCVGVDYSQNPYSMIVKAHPQQPPPDVGDMQPGDFDNESVTYWEQYRKAHSRGRQCRSKPSDNHPLLEVRRLPRRLENYLTVANKKTRPHRGDDTYLIPEMTGVHSIGAGIYESALLLPSVLARLSQILIAKDLNDSVFGGRIDPHHLVVALTGPTANHPFNYQRLEYLGDALLKSHVSAYVFAISDSRVEGQMNLHRREIVSNINLIEKSKHLEMGTKLYTRCFTRKTWAPPLCRIKGRPVQQSDTMHQISAKMVADMVESVIGAAVLTTEEAPPIASRRESYVGAPFWMNVDLGLQAIVDFGLLPKDCDTFEKIYKTWTDQIWPKKVAEDWDQRLHAGALHNLEVQIGYKFNSPHLALECMTHPSHLSSQLPSYQRLEFLGDAVLDFVVNCWLYQKYPDINEGDLTTLKGLAVCNQALCALSVHLKLHKFLQMGVQTSFASALSILTMDLEFMKRKVDSWYNSQSDVKEEQEKEEEQEEEEEAGEENLEETETSRDTFESATSTLSIGKVLNDENSNKVLPLDAQKEQEQQQPPSPSPPSAPSAPLRHYWSEVREMKALADLVESLLGAIFVDSGFNMKVTWEFFSRVYLPWFERYCHFEAFVQRTRRGRRGVGRKGGGEGGGGEGEGGEGEGGEGEGGEEGEG